MTVPYFIKGSQQLGPDGPSLSPAPGATTPYPRHWIDSLLKSPSHITWYTLALSQLVATGFLTLGDEGWDKEALPKKLEKWFSPDPTVLTM